MSPAPALPIPGDDLRAPQGGQVELPRVPPPGLTAEPLSPCPGCPWPRPRCCSRLSWRGGTGSAGRGASPGHRPPAGPLRGPRRPPVSEPCAQILRTAGTKFVRAPLAARAPVPARPHQPPDNCSSRRQPGGSARRSALLRNLPKPPALLPSRLPAKGSSSRPGGDSALP
jgi:hypothetical protein